MSCRCGCVGIVVSICVVIDISPRAEAAPFVNLNFEQATVPPGTPPGLLPAASAFPGWTPRIGDTVQSTVYYNFDGIGEPAVVLYDEPRTTLGLPVFQGRFSAELITGFATTVRGSVSQIGDIPPDARSLLVLSQETPGALQISINGIVVPLVRLTPGFPIDPAVFGTDVSMFAGMSNVELRFSSPVSPNGVIAGFDRVEFSADPIPEPAMGLAIVFCIGTLSQRNFGRAR